MGSWLFLKVIKSKYDEDEKFSGHQTYLEVWIFTCLKIDLLLMQRTTLAKC